jgi:plastocyanin
MKSTLKIVGLLLLIAACFTMVGQEILEAQDCRLVRVVGRKAPLLEPPNIVVSKGTCVIWFNKTQLEVKIIFEDGKKCQDVTDSPTGFTLDSSNCFVTTWLKYGSTSSLRFNEPGTYEYMVEFSTMPDKSKGKIVVE